MASCECCSKISTADALVLGAIQIMIGIFNVLMWYLLLILYMGQIKGVFGTYEPITYRTGCSLWGIIFIISGVSIIKVARHPTQRLLICAMIMNILCMITVIIATVLTVLELSSFDSVSYRNFGQARLGREISRVLLGFYPLELCIAFTYTIFGCIGLIPAELRGLHRAGICAGVLTHGRPRSCALGHNCGVGTPRGAMRDTTEAAGPTQQVLLQGLPEQKGPELRAPPVRSRPSGPVIKRM
ncbi:membrane-spanning 4-domains subfamily A member 13 [Camelus dromedarius]|uniref:membrane-spanning 4-domains subfamily A member 13 n=1 Tax=Camelus dromedarius TaxID=9838 RepID=UPI0003C8A0CB